MIILFVLVFVFVFVFLFIFFVSAYRPDLVHIDLFVRHCVLNRGSVTWISFRRLIVLPAGSFVSEFLIILQIIRIILGILGIVICVFVDLLVKVLRPEFQIRPEHFLLDVGIDVGGVGHGFVDAVLNDARVGDEIVDVEVDVLDHVARRLWDVVFVVGVLVFLSAGLGVVGNGGVFEVVDFERVCELDGLRQFLAQAGGLVEQVVLVGMGRRTVCVEFVDDVDGVVLTFAAQTRVRVGE